MNKVSGLTQLRRRQIVRRVAAVLLLAPSGLSLQSRLGPS
jgi:hypothetical protein